MIVRHNIIMHKVLKRRNWSCMNKLIMFLCMQTDNIAEKQGKPVKPDNPGDGVINIPPPDSNVDKHKPAEPDLPVKQPIKGEGEEQEQVKDHKPRQGGQPQDKVNEEPAGGHEGEKPMKFEEGKANGEKDKEGVHECWRNTWRS